jgi:hypothetical protein
VIEPPSDGLVFSNGAIGGGDTSLVDVELSVLVVLDPSSFVVGDETGVESDVETLTEVGVVPEIGGAVPPAVVVAVTDVLVATGATPGSVVVTLESVELGVVSTPSVDGAFSDVVEVGPVRRMSSSSVVSTAD